MELGGKASSLLRLKALGLHVPSWVIFHPSDSLEELHEKIRLMWGESAKEMKFAVRSSAKGEDGADLSFAGLFHTELNVPYAHLWEAVGICRKALDSEGLRNYLAHHQKTFHSSDLHLIIQEMVPAECAGVLFTVHPSGYADRRLVEVARGLGDQVVEAKVAVERWLFNKTTQEWALEATPGETILNPEQLNLLNDMSLKLEQSNARFFDVEFAFTGPKLHVLQARPITTLNNKKLMLLDGANIQENYPRVSTPLTLSGLQRGYEINFKSLLSQMGVDAQTIGELSEPLKNMTYVLNGHVYYRMENWIAIIARTPFFSKSALSSFQLMTGALAQPQNLKKKSSWRQSLTIFFHLARALLLRSHFERQYEEAMARFYQEAKNLHGNNQHERVKDILQWSERVYASYWFPLLNDLFCGLFLYLCTKILQKKNLSTTFLNDSICSIEDMESAKCVIDLKQLALRLTTQEIDSIVQGAPRLTQGTQRALHAYLEHFGDRSIEEMKIETPSKRENLPAFLCELVQLKKALENAPQKDKVSVHFELGMIFSWCLRQYTQALRFRENSRFHRVRVKGFLREEILRLSEKLGLDLFYLRADVLTLPRDEMRELIEARQKNWSKDILMPQRLLWFEGVDYVPLSAQATHPSPNEGLGCAGGIVEGEVLVIDKPEAGISVEGKILVAETTDPGWIYLMLQAKGLIIERGNMLSHTAIIGRELGIPTIISFPQAKQKLAGKRIRMSGQTGVVEIIDR